MARQSTRPPGATIIGVAALAEVSPSTVSRVMNGNTSVDPAIAERVRAAAAELRYSASPLARSLVLGRTLTVAILVPDLANPTFQGILGGLSRAAAADQYRVLIADSAENVADEDLLAVELRRRCDAIVLCAPRMSDDDLNRLIPSLAPVVVINRTAAGIDAPVVAADYASGIVPLAEHLYELGHRHLAYIEGTAGSASNGARRAGLRSFLATHDDVQLDILPGGATSDAGHDAADVVMGSGATACLAFNDLVAVGLISALHERGLSVPQDLSVSGFDDIPFSKFVTPALTTASVPVADLGTEAWRRIRVLLDGGEVPETLMVQPTRILRNSTAAPRS